jgi:hypothetical protein
LCRRFAQGSERSGIARGDGSLQTRRKRSGESSVFFILGRPGKKLPCHVVVLIAKGFQAGEQVSPAFGRCRLDRVHGDGQCDGRTIFLVVWDKDHAFGGILLEHGKFFTLGRANEVLSFELKKFALSDPHQFAGRKCGRGQERYGKQREEGREKESGDHEDWGTLRTICAWVQAGE